MRYGFIGPGHLGGHLGGHLAAGLLRHGFALTLHDRNRDAAERVLAGGAIRAGSAKALAANCDAVIACLPAPAASEAVLTGPDGILTGLQGRHLDRDKHAGARRDPAACEGGGSGRHRGPGIPGDRRGISRGRGLSWRAAPPSSSSGGRAACGDDAQSTQIVKLLEDGVGTDLRAPGFPARLPE